VWTLGEPLRLSGKVIKLENKQNQMIQGSRLSNPPGNHLFKISYSVCKKKSKMYLFEELGQEWAQAQARSAGSGFYYIT
jgi:hypothetical protein